MLAGKLPLDLLARLLERIKIDDPRVVLGPRAGEDAALIDFGDRYLVAKTDPITFATDLIGWYVVQVNANDLAVMGATPRWLMVTLLLPEGTAAETVQKTFDQLGDACDRLKITLVGGHTEITYDLPRPIAIGAMLGEVDKERVVLTSGARPGDAIVLTKGIAVEGTALLAREAEAALLTAGVDAGTVERAKDMLFSPGISVVRDAAIACDTVRVHAMHDPTEGGLATALREIAIAARVGIEVDADSIQTFPACSAICDALGLDPLGLLASGALLITLSEDQVPVLMEALDIINCPARVIGRTTDYVWGVRLRTNMEAIDLPVFERDELARYVSQIAPTEA